MASLSLPLALYSGVIIFLLGTVFGSFINCLSYRVVKGEDPVRGRSRCVNCGHELSPSDLVPVFSYVFLRGRCRYCGEKISPRYLIAEVLMGLLFLFAFIRFGLSLSTLTVCGAAVILMGLSLTDLESYEIPDGFIIALIIWWAVSVLLKALTGQAWVRYLTDGIIGGVSVAGGILLLSLIFDRLLGKESLGGGDIKLFFAAGLFLGVASSLFNLILSCLVGLAFAFLLKKNKIPFGPSIALSTYLSMLFGPMVTGWYLSLL